MNPGRGAVYQTLAALCAAALLVCLLVGGRPAEVTFALLAAAFPVALIALGAARGGRLGRLGPALAALLVLLGGSVVGLLLLRGRLLDGPWLADLPAGIILQLVGLCLAPLVLVALAYALTFDPDGLDPEGLERLRRRGAAAADREPT